MSEFKKGERLYHFYKSGLNSCVIPCVIAGGFDYGPHVDNVLLRFQDNGPEHEWHVPTSTLFRTESEAQEKLIEYLELLWGRRVEAFRKKCMEMDAKIAGLRKALENIKQE